MKAIFLYSNQSIYIISFTTIFLQEWILSHLVAFPTYFSAKTQKSLERVAPALRFYSAWSGDCQVDLDPIRSDATQRTTEELKSRERK